LGLGWFFNLGGASFAKCTPAVRQSLLIRLSADQPSQTCLSLSRNSEARRSWPKALLGINTGRVHCPVFGLKRATVSSQRFRMKDR